MFDYVADSEEKTPYANELCTPSIQAQKGITITASLLEQVRRFGSAKRGAGRLDTSQQ